MMNKKKLEDKIVCQIMKLKDPQINLLKKKFPINADLDSNNYVDAEKYLIATDIVGTYNLEEVEMFILKL